MIVIVAVVFKRVAFAGDDNTSVNWTLPGYLWGLSMGIVMVVVVVGYVNTKLPEVAV